MPFMFFWWSILIAFSFFVDARMNNASIYTNLSQYLSLFRSTFIIPRDELLGVTLKKMYCVATFEAAFLLITLEGNYSTFPHEIHF